MIVPANCNPVNVDCRRGEIWLLIWFGYMEWGIFRIIKLFPQYKTQKAILVALKFNNVSDLSEAFI